MFRTVLFILAICLLVNFVACGGGSNAVSPPPPQNPISVAISPTTATTLVGTSVRFSATVSGTTIPGVSYSVVEGGTSGQVGADGMYTAPAAAGTFRVRAISAADPSRFADATVTVKDYSRTMRDIERPRDAYDYHTATLLTNGSVLVIGGYGFEGTHRVSERYLTDPSSWQPAGSLNLARMAHAAVRLPNGNVLVMGGYDPTAPGTAFDPAFKSTEIYDVVMSQFAMGPDMTVPRRNHLATTLKDGRIFISGGIQLRGTGFSSSPATEIYDPASGTFAAAPRMMSGRWLHSATVLSDGRVLLVGGQPTNCTGTGGCDPQSLSTAEIYNPATGTLTQTGSLRISRYAHSAALLPDGRVLIVGGESTEMLSGTDQVATMEIYDPSTGLFSDFGQLADGRGFNALVVLNNGKLLVIGGKKESGAVSFTTEIVDPILRTSVPGPDMSQPRVHPTATRLLTGEVLVVGGNNSAQPVLPAEIFN